MERLPFCVATTGRTLQVYAQTAGKRMKKSRETAPLVRGKIFILFLSSPNYIEKP
jgi:hypothetical protein